MKNNNQSGRSMIEMLGVLAIIAVLTVGGIAGYSKAMEKFKLNKWKEDFAMLTVNLKTDFINSRSYSSITERNLVNFFKEINVVPQGMFSSDNKDILGNSINIYVRDDAVINAHLGISDTHITLQTLTLPNKSSVEQCKELFSMVLEYTDAWFVTLNEDVSGKTGGNYSVCGKSVPAAFAKHERCVAYNLTDVVKNCNICAKQNCDIKFTMSNAH